MIGKSGKYYRAGYLARQAGDWPDSESGNAGEEAYGDTSFTSGARWRYVCRSATIDECICR